MSLTEAKLQVCPLLATKCPADLEESLVVAPEKGVSMERLADDLESVADWDLVYLTGGLE